MNVSPGPLAFSSNRSISQSIASLVSSPFHFSESLGLFAFGTSNGTVVYQGKHFEFEISPSHNPITRVVMSDIYGITFFMTAAGELGVIDVFREIDGMKLSPHQLIAFNSRPTCFILGSLPVTNNAALFIGLESGKIMCIDITAAVNMETPRYVPSLFIDLSTAPPMSVFALSMFANSHLLIGTSDGSVRILRLEGKKFVASTPKTNFSIVDIFPIDSSTNPSFIVAYENGSVNSFDYNVCIASAQFSTPVSQIFATSIKPEQSCLIGRLSADKSLVRLDGPKWNCPSTIDYGIVSILARNPSSFFCLTFSSGGISSLIEKSIDLTNPLAPITSKPAEPCFGSLSLGPFASREPAVSIAISRSNQKFEPNMIRLGNVFTQTPLVGAERFLTDVWNSGTWEGMIVSAFNSPPELVFTVFSHTASFVIGKVPLSIPNFSIITTMDVRCDSSDRWSILLGFSSGRVGLVESYLDFPNPILVWRSHLLPSNGVHEGNKISRMDRSIMDGRIVMVMDSEGLCSFTRMTSDIVDEEDGSQASTTPDHVVMAGDNGAVFIDSKSNCAYACMSDGTVERIKTPRIRKSSGLVDAYDSENWETVSVIEGGFPLEGKFINIFPQFGIAVRESGIILMSFPTKHVPNGGRVTRVIKSRSPIIHSIIHLIGARCYLLVLTEDNSLQVYETSADGILVFDRSFAELEKFEARINKSIILSPSMHLIDFGKSITSLLFADRMKDIETIEPIISGAQKFFAFPSIKSTPLVTTASVLRENTTSSSTSSRSSGKKNLLSKLFGSKKKKDDDVSLAAKFQPTEFQLKQARDQLAKNLEKMAKLQDDTDEMQMASEEFLKSCNELNDTFDGGKKKGRKFLGMRF